MIIKKKAPIVVIEQQEDFERGELVGKIFSAEIEEKHLLILVKSGLQFPKKMFENCKYSVVEYNEEDDIEGKAIDATYKVYGKYICGCGKDFQTKEDYYKHTAEGIPSFEEFAKLRFGMDNSVFKELQQKLEEDERASVYYNRLYMNEYFERR